MQYSKHPDTSDSLRDSETQSYIVDDFSEESETYEEIDYKELIRKTKEAMKPRIVNDEKKNKKKKKGKNQVNKLNSILMEKIENGEYKMDTSDMIDIIPLTNNKNPFMKIIRIPDGVRLRYYKYNSDNYKYDTNYEPQLGIFEIRDNNAWFRDKNWITLNNYPNYEVLRDYYPNLIREKKTKKVVSETIHSSGYIQVGLKSDKSKLKQQIIAGQFVNNPKPKEYNVVDHIDNNRWNNGIDNLFWTSQEINKENNGSFKGIPAQFKQLKDISFDDPFIIDVDTYTTKDGITHQFDRYWYDVENDYFIKETEHDKKPFRQINWHKDKKSGRVTISLANDKGVHVTITKKLFYKQYNDGLMSLL